MNKILLACACCFIVPFYSLSQSTGFEGVLEYAIVFKYEPGFREKTVIGLKKLGSTDRQIRFFQADSLRIRTYIKQDSIWEESYLDDDKDIYKINFQAGFHAEIIDHHSGSRTMLSNLKEVEDFLENNTEDPNWRDKIKVSEWFNLDYSKLRKLGRRKEMIGGYLCQEYELPLSTPNSKPYYYWITEDLPSNESQQIPYFFNPIFTPKGVVLKCDMKAPSIQNQKTIRKITPGPIDPILPRLRSINFGTLDSVQYADQKLNQHLVGKDIEQAPILPNFSFYSVDSNQLESLYSRQNNGKFILIDFWATWCTPCLREMPQLAAFQAENAAILEVISLNQGDHRADQVRQVITQHNMIWTQGYAGKLLKAFLNPGKSIPHAILLDSNLKVRWRGNPAGSWDKLAEIIRGN
ncbi:TlpA family protein disulfide reductase [Haliscomenobacter sp.]|uniref:TlpA family protein disulfide reductase n=1 Tax=Haliscomenobacter sp. TaxID=2717303 RepID=UPI00359318A7